MGVQRAVAGFGIHGLGTYAVLMEANSAGYGGALNEAASRRVAAAAWSVKLNRSTAAHGQVGAFGPCDLVNGQQVVDEGGENAAIAHHAFVAGSYAHLSASYQRDYVRASFVGLTTAVNKILSDRAASADTKHLALGQYLHFAQSIFLQQDEASGQPIEVSAARRAINIKATQVGKKDGSIRDAALRAFAFTHQVAIAFNKAGLVPEPPAADRFDREFYGTLSNSDRARIVKTLREAGVYRFIEPIARVDREGASAPSESDIQRLLAGLEQVWKATHPKAADFAPPSMIVRDAGDFVDYDAHPEWLVPESARSAEEISARRVIDEAALAQQAEAMLRAKIEQLTQALKDSASVEQLDSVKAILQGLQHFHREGAAALKQFLAAREGPDKRRALVLALSNFQQGQTLAAPLVIDPPISAAKQSARPCLERLSAEVLAFEERLNRMISMLVATAFDDVKDRLPADTREKCLTVAFEALRSVFKGGVVEVPDPCLELTGTGRFKLALYARSRVNRQDPGLDELLSLLVKGNVQTGRSR